MSLAIDLYYNFNIRVFTISCNDCYQFRWNKLEQIIGNIKLWSIIFASVLSVDLCYSYSTLYVHSILYIAHPFTTPELVFLLNWEPGLPQRRRKTQELSHGLLWRLRLRSSKMAACVKIFLSRKTLIRQTFIVKLKDQHHLFRKQKRRLLLCCHLCTRVITLLMFNI